MSALCIHRVPDHTGFHTYACNNPTKHGEYCGVHSPERQAERKKKRGPTQYDRERARSKATQDVVDAARASLALWLKGDPEPRVRALEEALERYDKRPRF